MRRYPARRPDCRRGVRAPSEAGSPDTATGAGFAHSHRRQAACLPVDGVGVGSAHPPAGGCVARTIPTATDLLGRSRLGAQPAAGRRSGSPRLGTVQGRPGRFHVTHCQARGSRNQSEGNRRCGACRHSLWHEPIYLELAREGIRESRVLFAIEATHISIVYLRPTLELLGKAHPLLPATFI